MREIKLNKVYRHFKGKFYLVESLAINSETNETMVVYRHLYGDGSLCVRPLDMFLSEVDHDKYQDAKQKYRFEEVDEFMEQPKQEKHAEWAVSYSGPSVQGMKFFDKLEDAEAEFRKLSADESITYACVAPNGNLLHPTVKWNSTEDK